MNVIEKKTTHTVPILLKCERRSTKEQPEDIVRKAGFFLSFRWPKECLDFVSRPWEKVETMEYDGKNY
jgi:hypothetical protein